MPFVEEEVKKFKKYSPHDLIVNKISAYYSEKKFETYPRIKLGDFQADLISIRDQNLVIAFEIKRNNKDEIRKGIGQALSYMDWVHKVYLVVPEKSLTFTRALINNTPIGLYSIINDNVSLIREAIKVDPEYTKLIQLLGKTIGFCWLCGRTFNVVPKTPIHAEERGWIPITHKDFEPQVFKALEKGLGIKIKTGMGWVQICTVCSRIMGSAIGEYVKRVLKKEALPDFDFTVFSLKDGEEAFKKE